MQAAVIDQALHALDAGRAGEARSPLEAQSPKTAYVWALLARTYLSLQQPAAAQQAARQAEAGVAGEPRAQHALALYYAQSGDRKRAARLEHQFALSNDADPAAPARAAFLLAETGDALNAMAMAERALGARDRADLRVLLARLYEESVQPDKAVAQFQAALTANPLDEELHARYGQALLRMARFQQAAAALEEARAQFDRSAQIELALGVAYYAQRRFDDAASRFLRVIELDAALEQPYVFLARMIDQLSGRLPEILPRFAAWNRAVPRSHLPPFVYAKALPAGERRPLLEESIRRKADFWESHFELGLVLEQQRDFAGAAREMERTAALEPKQAAPHYRLARLYDRLGRTQAAARERARHAQLTAGEAGNGGMAR